MLHVVVSMGVIAMGQLLVIRIHRNEAAAGPSERRGHAASSVHSKG